MLLLSLQVVLADEDGEVCVADFEGLDLRIEPVLYGFPDGIRGGFKDVAE